MASFQKVFLRITGRVGDTTADTDKLPDRVMATGQIFLKPNIKDGWAEQSTADDGIDELMIPAPITCEIVNGMMTFNGDPYVWLIVGEENWNWNISFSQVRIAGAVRKIDAFNFDIEPATEEQLTDPMYQGVNLALLQEFTDPDTGNKAVRGPRGYSIDGITLMGSDQLVPSLDDPMNTSLPAITIPAITAANDAQDAAEDARDLALSYRNDAQTAKNESESARDISVTAKNDSESARDTAQGYAESFDVSIGTITTGAPGSPASLTIDDSAAPHFVINGSLPEGDQGIQGDPGPPVAPDSITSAELAPSAVDADALANNSVDTAAIVDDAVTADKIADNAVGSAQIAANAVGSSELADNAVDTAAIVNDAVTADKIADNAVGSDQIAANAVGASELADNAVDSGAIAAGAVNSSKIADDSIVNADINSAAAIALSKLAVGIMKFQKNTTVQNVNVFAGTEAQYVAFIASQPGGVEQSDWLYIRGA